MNQDIKIHGVLHAALFSGAVQLGIAHRNLVS